MFAQSSPRRPTMAPSSSYASVVAGQTRLSRPGENRAADTPPLLVPSPTVAHPNATAMSVANGIGHYSSNIDTSTSPTTVPPYLAETAYAEHLVQHQSKPHAPLTPPPSLTLPGKLPGGSYRGITFEVVEQLTNGLSNEPRVQPLPSKWNEADRSSGLEILRGGMEAKSTGTPKSSTSDSDSAVTVKADQPMPPQCGIFYFEITILSKNKEHEGRMVAIGFCSKKVPLHRQLGYEQQSWGYHGDDGNSFCCQGAGKPYGPPFYSGDVVGCGVNFRTRTAFFTKNGLNLGTAFKDIDITGELYPAVGMKRQPEHIRVNFGQERFAYDIENHLKREKEDVYASEIRHASLTSLGSKLSEDVVVRNLVASYLAHEGFIDTLEALAGDLKAANTNKQTPKALEDTTLFREQNPDVWNRQKIRKAVLAGDMDRAMELTNKYFPLVLDKNEQIHFKLKCRKLTEMIAGTVPTYGSKYPTEEPIQDVFDDMEMDDNSHAGSEWERMDISEESGKLPPKENLDAAVQYAQQLRIDFKADSRPEIRQALEESFSLVAYADPKNSELKHLFDEEGRFVLAEELNSAILVSQGKRPSPALEKLVQQSAILVDDASVCGGTGAFVNIRKDFIEKHDWEF